MHKMWNSEAIKAQERLKSILLQCRGLNHLNTNSLHDSLHEVPFKVLWNNRETIVSFGLSSTVNDQYMLHRLWHVLSEDTDIGYMRNLRHLTLRNVKIHGDSGRPGLHSAFVKLCQRLETLECNRCSMKSWRTPLLSMNNTHQTPPWTLKQVKLMKVMDSLSFHVHFLQRCTSLERLTWYSHSGRPLDPEFLQFLIQSRLKFLSVDGLKLPDRSLAELMEHLPPTISTLCLSPRHQLVTMGPRFVAAAAAISSHGLSLRSLLPWHSNLTSNLVQQLFSTCVDIVHFDNSLSVDAVDLLTAPWVMSRLVKLKLTINDVANLRTAMNSTHSDSGSGGLERIIYEQLSRLVSLEDLSLGEGLNPDFSGIDKSSWIEFSLRHGMGELATLERLRHLDISRLKGLKMDADEGEWICDHWPVLEQLVAHSLHEEIASHDYLMTYLHENRPRLRITED
ncbi:hypothetical protein B0O80DRAFT_455497 [Mortierella sp. GBAus27b]|nr:hypothetical protein B0O80DRAFT_455497 [Mortierella sp. GBAus27b]